jgi:hypothetical protein
VAGASAARVSAPQEWRWPPISLTTGVEAQPLLAATKRLTETMDWMGNPFPASVTAALTLAAQEKNEAEASAKVQQALDPLCLLSVHINPESRVKVAQRMVKPQLVQGDWRLFLIKVENEGLVTSELRISSQNETSARALTAAAKRNRWMKQGMFRIRGWVGSDVFNVPPFKPQLSGLKVEYRILMLKSRDAGKREATLSFDVGPGTQDIGFRSEIDILFDCLPSYQVALGVLDSDGKPTTARFTFRDAQNRTYPSQAPRIAPDLWFQPQVYRAHGQKIRLPQGVYSVEYSRGPEYLTQTRKVTVGPKSQRLGFQLKRWVDPAKLGWWSGDTHIHAAGCAHYEDPTQGVNPQDMIVHILGEDLKVGSNLTWGPCFDYQKQFFTGKVDKVSQYPYLLRYDVEVSGFGSQGSGHLVLLRLKEGNYPGGTSKDHWPTLGLNTLRWAKKQGAVVGPAHSALGLGAPSLELPQYIVPEYDSVGANEYVVDVTHNVPGPDGKLVPAVDFMSTVSTPYVWELNMWYHTLNCGFRTRVAGETDFPCLSGDRVGVGRTYVKLDGKLDFDRWAEGIRQGRAYVSDGMSHLLDFNVGGVEVGQKESEVRLNTAGTIPVRAKVSALLDATPNPTIKNMPVYMRPVWHLERARIETTRQVPVEVVVNGYPMARKNIVADGKMQDVSFDIKVERSSWVALRILGSSHSNPIFVLVDNKPIRASRRSAEWCLKGVDKCWSQKERFYAAGEKEDAKAAYEHARQAYRRILSESETE